MKYIIIICMLFTSCSIFKKTINTQKQDVSKSTLQFKDSSGSLVVYEVKKTDLNEWGSIIIDSSYDTWTNVIKKDYGDSVITIRTTKEKGQKKTEQLSHTSKRDTTSNMISEHSQLQEIDQEDSSAVTVTKQKDVDRTTFLPWWLWLIVAVPVAVILFMWKQNSIVKFFT